ncbi:MAG TPA: SDR family oxidoreductase [Methylomirabilota bacterium]|nr:SDR family oxidoreductase [Methylomirabilota bacterium]
MIDAGLRLQGRVILVTGAGRGIGRATCMRLASEGAKVICADLDVGNAAETAAAIGEVGLSLRCDVTDPRSAEATVAEGVAHFGSLWGLMNNAAAPSIDATVVDLALADWQREIAVSLTGAFLMSKFAVPHMTAKGGSIVHVASQFARVAVAGSAAYCAAKAGLVNLAKVMALDHAHQGIRVNTLSPGAVGTERLAAHHGSIAEAERKLAPKHPIGRIARPEEIAAAAAFLMSDDSSFMTGADLLVDGGYAAQ